MHRNLWSATAILALLLGANTSQAVTVSSCGAIRNNLANGVTITVANGTYSNCDITINQNNVTIRAANPQRAKFTNRSHWIIRGNRNRVEDLHFDNGQIRVDNGDDNEIVHNEFVDIRKSNTPNAIEIDDGDDNKVIGNYIHDFAAQGIVITGRATDTEVIGNHLKNNVRSNGGNGYECLQSGRYSGDTDVSYRSLIEFNLFDNCSVDGEGEVISIKSSDNEILQNHFKNSPQAGPSLRHGSRNRFEGNRLDRVKGLAVQGKDNLVINNLFRNGADLLIRAGNITQTALDNNNPQSNVRPRAEDTIVAHNRIRNNGRFVVGDRCCNQSNLPAKDTKLFQNSPANPILDHEDDTSDLSSLPGNPLSVANISPGEVGLNYDTGGSNPPPQGDEIEIEAEDGTLSNGMAAANNGNASGGQYVWAPEGVGNNSSTSTWGGPEQVRFNFSVPNTDNYVLWARVRTPNRGSDSFFIRLNGANHLRWNTGVNTNWRWKEVDTLNLSGSGSHTLTFRKREDGAQLDKIILSSDPNFSP